MSGSEMEDIKISDQERGVIGERDIDGGYNIDLMDEI